MVLSLLDVSLIILFFIGSIIAGWLVKGDADKNLSGFIVAGKSVPLSIFVMTNVATWYGGILGVGEFSYQFGLLNWFTQGLPYYLFAILYAFLFVGRIKSNGHYTIPHLIQSVYGKKNAITASAFIFLLASPAPYLLMTAYILVHIFQIPLSYAVLIVSLTSILYLLKGGYKSDLTTDIYFFFIMFLGFAAVLGYFISTYGGYSYLSRNLPPTHLQLTGGASWSYILVWYLIAIWTFADPGFFQRVQSAKSVKVAKYGILLSVLLWFSFDLLTNGLGLYARALMPGLGNSADAFLQLADGFIPGGLRGVFYIGMFATILSTLNSFFFISSVTLAHDIVLPLMENSNKAYFNQMNDSAKVNLIKAALFITGILGGGLALLVPSVIGLWYGLGSLCIPPLIYLLLSVYYPRIRISNSLTLIHTFSVFLVGALSWYMKSNSLLPGFLMETEPMLLAMGYSILSLCILLVFSKRNIA